MRRRCVQTMARQRVAEVGTSMIEALRDRGFYERPDFLGNDAWRAMRGEAMRLREDGRFAASLSVDMDGRTFAKPGVESCEIDADDDAPALIDYTRDMVTAMPQLLNGWLDGPVSTRAYGTKLAVTLPGASYPLHVDNACAGDDIRWITCLYYMNEPTKGGELRLWLDDDEDPAGTPYDIEPVADKLVVFFADRLVHEVLPTTTERYALTLWLVEETARPSHVTPPRCAELRPGRRTRDYYFASS